MSSPYGEPRGGLALRQEGKGAAVMASFDPASSPPPGVRWDRDRDRWIATLRSYYPVAVMQVVLMAMSALAGSVVFTVLIGFGLAGISHWGFVGAMFVGPLFIKFPFWPPAAGI